MLHCADVRGLKPVGGQHHDAHALGAIAVEYFGGPKGPLASDPGKTGVVAVFNAQIDGRVSGKFSGKMADVPPMTARHLRCSLDFIFPFHDLGRMAPAGCIARAHDFNPNSKKEELFEVPFSGCRKPRAGLVPGIGLPAGSIGVELSTCAQFKGALSPVGGLSDDAGHSQRIVRALNRCPALSTPASLTQYWNSRKRVVRAWALNARSRVNLPRSPPYNSRARLVLDRAPRKACYLHCRCVKEGFWSTRSCKALRCMPPSTPP